MKKDNLPPILSVLVPSRERARALKFSLTSLGLKRNNIEVLVWVDDDDPQLGQYHKLFDKSSHIKMFIKPRVGYINFHIMINYLALQSKGDWLWLWNDDAYMEKTDWYGTFINHAALSKPREEPVVYNICKGKNGFPIVSRKYLEILGHFAGSATCDLWTRRVAQGAHIQRHIPGIEPTHRKYGHDTKMGDLRDTTYNSVESLRVKHPYFGGTTPGVKKAQKEDEVKIVNWINQNKQVLEAKIIISPQLSILVPSRGRASHLKFSLDSLGLDENNLEALIWVDEDDPQLKTYHQLFDGNNRIKIFVKPRVGYRNFHIMINFLATNSSSDWFFLWNDDAYMDSTNWYTTFAGHASLVDPGHDPIVFDIWGQGSNDNSFPIISRKYFGLLGYFAPTAYSNLYVKYVAIRTKIHRTIFGIKPNHRNYGRDKKMGDIIDDTKKDIDALKQRSRWMGLLTKSMWNKKQEDVATILEFVKKRHAGFIGLGKLGLPVALAMEARGNRLVGYDMNPKIRNYLKEKKGPFREEHIEGMLATHLLELANSIEEVVQKTDLIFCAVQTPHEPRFEGHKPLKTKPVDFDYSYLKKAIKDIASAAKKLNKKITLGVISTCLPGTYKREIKSLLNPNINYIYNPYFIAMGTVINDFYNPEFILIGKDEGDITPLVNFYKLTLGDKKMIITDITTAEGIKVFYNTFVTTKTVLGNMYGEFAHKIGMNADHIYEALSSATDRLISPKYLKSGVGDGGGCHPRDNIALSYLAKKYGMSFNIFESLIEAREKHMEWLASLAKEESNSSGLPIVILGKSFKPETNIETGSSAILLANILRGSGTKFTHWGLNYPKRLPVAVYILATQHNEYSNMDFPNTSIVIDPFRYIKKRDGVKVISIGGNI